MPSTLPADVAVVVDGTDDVDAAVANRWTTGINALKDALFKGHLFDVTHPDYGATGDGSTDDTTAITDAVTGAAGCTLLFPPGTYKVTSNFTVADGIDVIFLKGAQLTSSSAVTVTFNGSLQAGIYQILAGSITAAFAKTACAYVLPQWWGAVGDDSTACATAFDAAMTAAHNVGKLLVPTGTYRIATPLDNFPVNSYAAGRSGMVIQGNGTFSVLKYMGTTGYCIEVTNPDKTNSNQPVGNIIRDLHFEAGSIADPDDGGCILITGSDTTVEKVTMSNVAQATGVHCRSRDTHAEVTSETEDTNNDFTSSGVSDYYGIKFTSPIKAMWLHDITVKLRRTGSPGGSVYAEVWTDSAGSPNAQTGADSESYSIAGITTGASGEDITITWTGYTTESNANPTVSPATTYWLVLRTDGSYSPDGSNYLSVMVDSGDGPADGFATYDSTGPSWATSNDGVNYDIECKYSQALNNYVSNSSMYGTGRIGRAFWIEDQAFLGITDTYAGAKEGLRSETGYVNAYNMYLFCSGVPVYATGWTTIHGGVIEGDGDSCYFGGRRRVHRLIGIIDGYAPMTWQEGTDFKKIGCHKDVFFTDAADVPPDVWRDRVLPADEARNWETSGAYTTDAGATSLNGNSIQLDAQNEYARVEFGAALEHYALLPRGTYKVTVWMRDANQVTQDAVLTDDYWGGASWVSQNVNKFTLTADYRPYTLFMRIIGSQVGDIGYARRFVVRKDTATANTVHISHAQFEYIGQDLPYGKPLAVFAGDYADTDNSRRAGLEFWGAQGGTPGDREIQAALAQIVATHDGSGADHKGQLQILTNSGAEAYDTLVEALRIEADGGVFLPELKSGANQGAAGAAAGEMWIDTGDQTVKVGV